MGTQPPFSRFGFDRQWQLCVHRHRRILWLLLTLVAVSGFLPARAAANIQEQISAGGNGLQMLLDTDGVVWARNALTGAWTQESQPGNTAIAAGYDGTQMLLDANGAVWATGSIGGGWVQEAPAGEKAIAAGGPYNGGGDLQMMLGGDGTPWAKYSIGANGWTNEAPAGEKAIAAGGNYLSGALQMMLGGDGTPWAKYSIGLNGWTNEAPAGEAAISAGGPYRTGALQMMLGGDGTPWAKNSIGLNGWTNEAPAGEKAISAGCNGLQMMLGGDGTPWAKNSIGLNGWQNEAPAGEKAISAGCSYAGGTLQMMIGGDGTVWAKTSIGLNGWSEEALAPTNTSAPVVSDTTYSGNTPQLGDKLSTSNGSWSGDPTSYAYAWQRCDSAGNNCSNIQGPTSSTYVVQTADIGSTIKASVTASNATGQSSATSTPTGVVATWYGEFTSGCPDASLYPGNQSTLAWINGSMTCPSDPNGSGQTVSALSVQSSGGSGVVRADLFSPPGLPNSTSTAPPAFADGSSYYVSIPTLLPAGLPTITYGQNSFFQVWQFDHPGPCCNPILGETISADDPVTGAQIDSQGNNHFIVEESIIDPSNDQITGTAGYWIGPAVDTNWHTVTIQDNFSSSSNGSVQLWWDGVSQVWNTGSTSLSGIVTLPFGNTYPYSLDVDQYRAAAISGTFTVWHGAPKIGSTLASVTPDVSPQGP